MQIAFGEFMTAGESNSQGYSGGIMTDYRTIYATFKDKEQAVDIANQLVQEKLAACVNVLPEMLSVYEWDGEIEQSGEVAFFAKTHRTRVDDAIKRIVQLHSYETPCVVVLTIDAGHQAYLDWIGNAVCAG